MLIMTSLMLRKGKKLVRQEYHQGVPDASTGDTSSISVNLGILFFLAGGGMVVCCTQTPM